MYRNDRILQQKGMMKVASVYDTLAVSNREPEGFQGVAPELNALLEDALQKTASFEAAEELDKKASFANGLQMFSDVRRLISDKLGVSEGIAHNLASNVISRSERIAQEYGGNPTLIADNIVQEMKGQVIDNPNILGGAVDLHPFAHHNKDLQDQIKQRLVTELHMSQREAEVYKKLILRQAQDMTTMLRPHKRDEIASAIVTVIVKNGDVTSIYDLKDTPVLLNSIKAELGV